MKKPRYLLDTNTRSEPLGKLNHQPTAIVISLAPADVESFALSRNPQFLEIIENARTELKRGKKLSLEEIKQEIW